MFLLISCIAQAFSAMCTGGLWLSYKYPVVYSSQLTVLIMTILSQFAVPSRAYRCFRRLYCGLTDQLFRPTYSADALGAVVFCSECSTTFNLENQCVGSDLTSGTGCTLNSHTGKIIEFSSNAGTNLVLFELNILLDYEF